MLVTVPVKFACSQQLLVYDENGRGMSGMGYGPGWSYAVRFTPMSYPFFLRMVGFVLDWEEYRRPFNLVVWDQSPNGPGNILGSLNNISARDTGLNWYDVSSLNISINNGNFYAGIYWLSNLGPWLFLDDIPPIHNRSWFYDPDSSRWYSEYGEDFEIRAANYLLGIEAQSKSNEGIVSYKAIPNPFVTYAKIPGHSSDGFALYDVSGRKVGVFRGDRIGYGLTPGVYFLRPENGSAKPLRIVKVR
jgi:hypothetical protein